MFALFRLLLPQPKARSAPGSFAGESSESCVVGQRSGVESRWQVFFFAFHVFSLLGSFNAFFGGGLVIVVSSFASCLFALMLVYSLWWLR